MRVGFITYGLDRSTTGIGHYAIELAKTFAQNRTDVDIILLNSGELGPLGALGLPVVPIRMSKLAPLLMTSGALQLPWIAKQHKLDIIHDPVGIVPFLAGTGRAKSVSTIHDVIPLSFPGLSTRFDSLVYERWLPYKAPKIDAIITVSEYSKSEIHRYLGVPQNKIHVTTEAADNDYRVASKEKIQEVRKKYALPDPYILYVGSLEERKNLRRVLEAYGRIRTQGISHKLAIVGPKKWHYSEIEKKIESLGISEDLILTGYVAQEDLPALYSGADVFVFPTLYEGFGLPPLEAMACGTAVVTSNSSSIPEVVGDAAISVDPYDTDAIADALRQVLLDSDLRKKLEEAGLKRAASFSWARTMQQTIDVYKSVIG